MAKQIGNFTASSMSYFLAQQLKERKLQFIIAPNSAMANQLYHETRTFAGPDAPLYRFLDTEVLPYDQFSPHEDIISNRLELLNKLPQIKQGYIFCPIQSIMTRLAPESHTRGQNFQFKKGDAFDFHQKRTLLERAGYNNAAQVERRGEFTLRGSIFDVYPMGSSTPYRIDLFDDEIDSIRTFDVETQRSGGIIDEIDLLPAHEYPLTNEACKRFCQNWYDTFSDNTFKSPILNAIEKRKNAAGLEGYLPFFFEQTANFFDYIPSNAGLIFIDDLMASAEHFWQDIQSRAEACRFDLNRPPLAPIKLYFEPNDVFKRAKTHEQLKLSHKRFSSTSGDKFNSPIKCLPDIKIEPQAVKPWLKLQKFVDKHRSDRILFCAESDGRREILLEHLAKIGLTPLVVRNYDAFTHSESWLCITSASFDHGFIDKDQSLILIAENELFHDVVAQRRRQKSSKKQLDGIRDISEITVNMPVVHIEHGVGRYLGLQTLDIGGKPNDFITLEYAKGDKLYVPVANLHLISRYSSTDLEHAPVNTLGTDTWSKQKSKALKRIYDTAAELLEIYAKREAKTGFRYDASADLYANFAAAFPFEETPDQSDAIDAVITDMCAQRPMDRLLCGDVGFGKTEVAMRAAFIAVQNNKQVAVLVPTTLLANQHFENFQDRFANWPVNVQMLSRFKTEKQNQQTIDGINSGKVDIVIGTHKLLSKMVDFNDLGLAVIDEEHRFGVRHKEKLKALRADVDILAMSATPIPRSLNLAMAHIRDLSIIATPPLKRLSIKTFVHESQDILIKEAILRETLRGGQVYFLHNDVKTIELKAQELNELMPDINIAIGHGQMSERELEKVMSDFYHNRYQVLVCSTIIETGIDVPNANTIIINRADKLGLAQLHQLRGRVGRSHHQAYAYLLTPPWKSLTKDAQLRLEAIERTRELGAGFTLASHDLEIRGAGEILGQEQAGHMQHIGFSLYMELLDRAVKALEKGEKPALDTSIINDKCDIDLGISAIIPDSYIGDVGTRLTLYRRLANIDCKNELDEIQVEMIDRFGLLPEQTKMLIKQVEMRLLAEKFGLQKIKFTKVQIKMEFKEKHKVDPLKIIKLIQSRPDLYKMVGSHSLAIVCKVPEIDAQIMQLEACFEKFE